MKKPLLLFLLCLACHCEVQQKNVTYFVVQKPFKLMNPGCKVYYCRYADRIKVLDETPKLVVLEVDGQRFAYDKRELLKMGFIRTGLVTDRRLNPLWRRYWWLPLLSVITTAVLLPLVPKLFWGIINLVFFREDLSFRRNVDQATRFYTKQTGRLESLSGEIENLKQKGGLR